MRFLADLSKEQQIVKGREAENLLRNELLTEVLDYIEADMQHAWANSVPSDREKRELAYQLLQGVYRFRAELRALLQNVVLLQNRNSEDDNAT